ncbi:hypothetical protein [Streptomyces griseus]|uniref:hypothetical protein n=1 Tax=Streptomyces griseus TaxID=1911 RepID=UPI00083FF741|nr:hypothetical protein [Streptomyces griseus]
MDNRESAEPIATLGVLLTPRRGGNPPWDTTSIRVEGQLDLPDDDPQLYRQAWNRTPEDATPSRADRRTGPPYR